MAATISSSTVDLSRLPAPTIIEQLGFEAIVAQLIAAVQVDLPSFDATIDSDPAVKVLQVAAYREVLIRQAFQDAALQLLTAYARGPNLEQRGVDFGVSRLVLTPADPATGADAVMEDDESLRQRIVLAPEGFTTAGTELSYVKRAKDAGGDVLDASATSPARGRVLVSVLSRIGDGTASPDLVAAVAAIVTDRAVRPLGDAVTVASAVRLDYTITATLTTFAGPDITIVLQAARAALDAYIATNRKLGRKITRSGLYAALTVAGVEGVEMTSPIADVAPDLTQFANCTDITIAHAGYAS